LTQLEKAERFKALHHTGQAFIIPNPYDVGTARLLASYGFEALATTSAGFAFTQGMRDRTVGRERMMAHVAEIAEATHLPVSGDLENGFGDEPEEAAETVRQAAAAGLVGASIEDSIPGQPNAQYDPHLAEERILAAVEAARALPFPFTLTARAENFISGNPDLDATIGRLQAYEKAGADVLYAPGLSKAEQIGTVVRAVGLPVNVVMGLRGTALTQAELSELGVARISVGSALARTALATFLRAAEEMAASGTFKFAEDAVNFSQINDRLDT